LHPTDRDRVLSVVKVRDSGLAKNLKEEFELLWNAGKKLDLQEELEDKQNPGKN